jgi:hypothetical protein
MKYVPRFLLMPFPMFSSRNSGDYLATTPVGDNTPLISRPNSKSKREFYLSYSSLAAIFIFLLVLVPLSGLCGAWIQWSVRVSRDIVDPKVRDQIRREWSIELETHNRAMEHAQAEEREWQEKKENREREESERAEREKRNRDLMGLYWDDAQGEHCIAYRTRRYRARLENLLPSINVIEACKATPITIHSLTYDSPLYCEDTTVGSCLFSNQYTVLVKDCDQTIFRGPSIYGHWVVHDDPFCSTYWQSFTDHVSRSSFLLFFNSKIYRCIRTALHQVQVYVYVVHFLCPPCSVSLILVLCSV